MIDFQPGQCWISDAELNLGIGFIETVEFRFIHVFFPSCNEQRTYAKQSAPLTRLTFGIGDSVTDRNGQSICIKQIEEDQGLLSYSGLTADNKELVINEVQLNPVLQLNRPAERLFNLQIDPDKCFFLRYQTYSQLNQLYDKDLLSLTGSRTSLIPHQLYVAHNVATRYAPRVLLADEVGLGKTIEAGMILQYQLYSQRVKRVLVVVPDNLLHQWLIEMLRRFNLRFSIFDDSRFAAEQESSAMDNPFFAEQLVICTLSFLTASQQHLSQAVNAQWDLLIVDEAHHLLWNEEGSSKEYQCIEQLSKVIRAVLLLTATPEQLGKQSHFARLRLLDPDRFPDFEQFVTEEQQYQPIAQLVEQILSQNDISVNDKLLTTQQQQLLRDNQFSSAAKNEVIEQLLDRHGTGRLLFRNTRMAVSGFPKRLHNSYAIELPLAYQECLLSINDSSISDLQLLLSPELIYQQAISESPSRKTPDWFELDGRVDWLANLIKKLSASKILIICAYMETAQQLNLLLKQQYGIHSAVFHEALNLVERDRAAAYFADPEAGCQVLVCSEIGSEGRNFQFSHHLVLFDLPLNPDLLEQRIGRLDRIGQTENINIHIPYFKNSAQQLIYHWYQDGLDAFEQSCPAAPQVYKQLQPLLFDLLHHYEYPVIPGENNQLVEEHRDFIKTTRQLREELNKQLHQGRDRLLELNSCRKTVADKLLAEASQNDSHSQIQHYLEQAFDVLGVDSELYREGSFILRPGDKMQLAISGLEDDGLTCTCNREIALANEDMQYLNWIHPLVRDVMDQIISSELGNTAMIIVPQSSLQGDFEAGSLLLQSLYLIESDHAHIQEMFAIAVNIEGKEVAQSAINFQSIQLQCENIDAQTRSSIIQAYKDEVKNMLQHSQSLADKKSHQLIESIYRQKLNKLNEEKQRLTELQKINPAVRAEEIEFFEQEIISLQKNKQQTTTRLDACCLIVVT